jgi:hypothetical protein
MYFPKSQITPNLYTNGNEFVIETSKVPYVGYYFKTSNGKYYTGKNTSDRPNEELVFLTPQNQDYPLNPELSVIIVDPIYDYIKQPNNPNNLNSIQFIPYYSPMLPTSTDYQVGEFRRYFCKKTNELIYIEINQSQYKQLVSKDPQILWALYQPFFIDWQLVGDKQKVAQINRNSVDLLVLKQKFFGLNQYLKFDYTKYFT